ncbi:hypothetical protein PLESTB_001073100 [Pleodorina starrii]|uniref:RRM domain-containing protein n=1 Tax=Pleodorina starrii TaxID=330485 RepID=A0A9W6BPP1_9CHLO|nr:hypothetical protein PLESTB_001073100 [Pleodorina starrii]
MPETTESSSPSEPVGPSEEPPPLHRLFVGSVPRTAVEATLRGYFEQCGVVRDLAILRDRSSGKSRGCAFVSYLDLEEAEEAIQKFDRQLLLPGSQTPLEVRFAKNHSYVQAGSGPTGNRQLFFSRVPLFLKEDDVRPLFEAYGPVEGISVFKCRRSGRSKGCGFVEMQSREDAMRAMENLDEQHVFEATGTSLSVRWADPELQQRKKKAMDDANADNRMLFFAKALRSTTEDEVRRLFSLFGKVHDVNLFRAFQGAPTTKGCGLVTMSQHPEAVAAIDALDGKHVWEGMDCPMVVKWMDTALQRRRREQHLASTRQPQPQQKQQQQLSQQAQQLPQQPQQLPQPQQPQAQPHGQLHPLPSTSLGFGVGGLRSRPALTTGVEQEHMPYQPGQATSMSGVSTLGGPHGAVGGRAGSGLTAMVAAPASAAVLTATAAAAAAPPLGGGAAVNAFGGGLTAYPPVSSSSLAAAAAAGMDSLESPLETPPPGCDPDVIKLFVGNIPKNCSEELLLPLFQSIGKVVELVIVYDKVTHESKGSAFVWFATREDAERAILQFNLRHVFPDPTGAQDRPLVVRRAKARRRMAAPAALFAASALGQVDPGTLATPYQQRLVGMGMGMGDMGDMGGQTGGDHLALTSLPAGMAMAMEGLQLVDGAGMGMGMGMGMGTAGGMGAVRGLGGIGGGASSRMAAAATGQQPGLGVVGIGGGGGAAGRGMQGLMALAPAGTQQAGLYDMYGAGDQLLVDYGAAAATMSVNQTGGGGAAAAGGGYVMMLPTGGALTGGGGGGSAAVNSQWEATAAAAAAAAGAGLAGGGGGGGGSPLTYAIPLTAAQLQAVNPHLYSLQAVSGATLQLSSAGGVGGMFHLLVSGPRHQLETTRQLVATVLSGVV